MLKEQGKQAAQRDVGGSASKGSRSSGNSGMPSTGYLSVTMHDNSGSAGGGGGGAGSDRGDGEDGE